MRNIRCVSFPVALDYHCDSESVLKANGTSLTLSTPLEIFKTVAGLHVLGRFFSG